MDELTHNVIREDTGEYKESEMSQMRRNDDSVSESSLENTISNDTGSRKTNPIDNPIIKEPIFRLKSDANYYSMKVEKLKEVQENISDKTSEHKNSDSSK